MSTRDGDEVFDLPAMMRLDVVKSLGLGGEERVAGLATGAGYPDSLDAIIDALSGRTGVVIDVGAGLGAAAAFMARAAGADVKGVEPEVRVARLARDAFPDVAMVAGTAAFLPFADQTAAAVTFLGAVSLIDDLEAALSEAVRVVSRDGLIAITDLCLRDGHDDLRSGPNVFRSPSSIVDALTTHGYVDVSEVLAPADSATRWDDITATVDRALEDRYGSTEPGRAWKEDRQRLRGLIQQGRLGLATFTATWSPGS